MNIIEQMQLDNYTRLVIVQIGEHYAFKLVTLDEDGRAIKSALYAARYATVAECGGMAVLVYLKDRLT